MTTNVNIHWVNLLTQCDSHVTTNVNIHDNNHSISSCCALGHSDIIELMQLRHLIQLYGPVYVVWRSQPLAKNVGSGADSVLDLFTWNADVMT